APAADLPHGRPDGQAEDEGEDDERQALHGEQAAAAGHDAEPEPAPPAPRGLAVRRLELRGRLRWTGLHRAGSASPSAMSATSSTGRLVDVGDTALHVVERGDGFPILLLHGGPGLDHHEFADYLDPLADAHRLILVDQRAQGRSAPADPATW